MSFKSIVVKEIAQINRCRGLLREIDMLCRWTKALHFSDSSSALRGCVMDMVSKELMSRVVDRSFTTSVSGPRTQVWVDSEIKDGVDGFYMVK
jgi:hypothetical protein